MNVNEHLSGIEIEDWEICWNSALFKLPILMSLLCSFKRTWMFRNVSPIYFNLQFLLRIQYTLVPENMVLRARVYNSQIVLEGKDIVLILSIFVVYYAVRGRIVWQNYESMGGTSFIRLWVGISSRLIFIVDFEGFTFSKLYKRFGV